MGMRVGRQFFGISRGVGGNFHCYSKMENLKGWRDLYEIPSVVGVWIPSGTKVPITLNDKDF